MNQKGHSKNLETILREMCRRVNANYDEIDFKKAEWFRKYLWTKSEEIDFKKWFINKIKNDKEIREMFKYPRLMTNKQMREKAVETFILSYGWKEKI